MAFSPVLTGFRWVKWVKYHRKTIFSTNSTVMWWVIGSDDKLIYVKCFYYVWVLHGQACQLHILWGVMEEMGGWWETQASFWTLWTTNKMALWLQHGPAVAPRGFDFLPPTSRLSWQPMRVTVEQCTESTFITELECCITTFTAFFPYVDIWHF